jgi:hypothetical protein
MIAPTELTQNYERLNAPYDPNEPIETLFQQIQDNQAFAVAGGRAALWRRNDRQCGIYIGV